VTVLAVLLLCASAAFACGPFFSDDDLVIGGVNPLTLNGLSFAAEIAHITGQPLLVGPLPQAPHYNGSDPACNAMVQKDVSQLHDALLAASTSAEEVQRTLEEYGKMRASMCEHARKHRDWETETAQRRHWDPVYTPSGEPPAFELATYEPLLTRLPGEFSFYVRGAAAYQHRDYETALQTFTQILDLPPEQRPCRTVWAAYMRAMALLRLERYSDAMTAYAGIPELVHAGFADPLLLANESTGWTAHIKLKQGSITEAISLYLDYYAHGDYPQRNSAIDSLDRVMRSLDRGNQADQLDRILGDERLREVLIVWYTGEPAKKVGLQRMLSRLDKLPAQSPLACANKIAWLAYEMGDFDAAKHWLHLSPADSAISMWVQSKLLLRDGKLPEAADILAELVKILEQSQDPLYPETQEAPHGDRDHPDMFLFSPANAQQANMDLATVLFKMGTEKPASYTPCLDAFIKAGSWLDAAYVAEHNVSLGDLVSYASTLKPTGHYTGQFFVEGPFDVRHLCARRLAREATLEQAIPF
jgi:tetratricopeptide (TPR) repeat protein